jgi:hypothetical protein
LSLLQTFVVVAHSPQAVIGGCRSGAAVSSLRRRNVPSDFGAERSTSGVAERPTVMPPPLPAWRNVTFYPASISSLCSTECEWSFELHQCSSQGCGSVTGTPSPSRTAHSEAPNGGSFWQQKAGTPVGSLLRPVCKSQPAHLAPGISGNQAVQAQRNKQATHTNTKRSNKP